MKNELIRLASLYAAENNSKLRGADFKIYKGEAVGLVGGFHSGKMLLMEIIAGSHIPSQGYRFIHGKPVSFDDPFVDLRVKYLKKNFGLIGPMTVWENIAAYRRGENRFLGLLRPERMREQAQELMALYGIEASPGILADQLTATQKFAVALIKARLEGTELILAENSELEYSVSGFRLMQRLLKLCREHGISVMFSGIEAGGFSPLLDRICLMDAGRIIWEEEVKEGPKPEAAFFCGAMPGRLNIPVERPPLSIRQVPSVRVLGERFSITGRGGQFLMMIDPEQALDGVFPDTKLRTSFFSEGQSGIKDRPVRIRQIDFSCFDRLVKWMSPADNLTFGLSAKAAGFGIVKPHLKRYILREFVRWTGEEAYQELEDCESLVIGERIKIASFRLKLDKPDVVVFRHFQFLDQDSRAIVLPVLSDLLKEGAVLIGISTFDDFSDFADGYYLLTDGKCSEEMNYGKIRDILDGNEENEA